jgi:DNA modification methylase
MVEVFRCVWDVLEDDGTLWLNIGDSYYNYRPGKGQALVQQTVSNNSQDLPQVCARRGNKLDGLKEKDLIGIPWMLAFALRADGWYLRQDIIWHKPNPMPESVQDRCTKAHEYIFLLSKSSKYFYDADAIKEKSIHAGEQRSFNSPKKAMRNVSGEISTGNEHPDALPVEVSEFKNKRSVWTVNPKPYEGAHFAVFPQDLIEPCIMAGAPVGGIVLDPFMGSGTTAQVAQHLGRQYLGCELNFDYKPLQDKRISQLSLELV